MIEGWGEVGSIEGCTCGAGEGVGGGGGGLGRSV